MIRNGIQYADYTTIPDIPNIVTGFYTYSDDDLTASASAETDAKAALWAHKSILTKNNQSINAIISVMSGTGSVHVIGSKLNNSRGRYIAFARTSDTVVSVRITDDGATYVTLTTGTAVTIT